MSTVVEVADAQDQLAELVARAQQGEEIILAEAGKACVRLVAMVNGLPDRPLGTVPGDGGSDDVFFAPLTEEELADWEQSPLIPGEAAAG